MQAVNDWVIKPVQTMREMEFPNHETFKKIAESVLTLGISTLKSPIEPQYALASKPQSSLLSQPS